MKRTASLVLLPLAITAAVPFISCGGGSSPALKSQITTVTVAADAPSTVAGSTIGVTATVIGDSSNQGVSWSVSCNVSQCGSVSPPSTTSGVSAIYTAPPSPLASDLSVTVTAKAIANNTKSGSIVITVLAAAVAISPKTASVQAGSTLQLTASVNNDLSGQGVSWSISPTSGAGSLSNQTASDVTYTAPTTPPASDVTVTVTATSIADPSKSDSATITIPFVQIAVTPATATTDAGSSVPNIVATVINDSSHRGVTWSVSCSAAPCGSVSPTSTASGASTTYTAPPAPPSADLAVNVVATSVADPSAQTSMVITVKAISVTVTAPVSSVLFGGTVQNIVAVVNDDPAHKGVTWSLSCLQCGSISPNATASGGAVTYSAPTTPPASDLVVTIVATSVSDQSKQGSVDITVPAITISVTPTTAIIPVDGAPQFNATPFTATVNNDSSNQGVSWTLLQTTTSCSPACGTMTPTTTTSGNASTYAAPTSLPTTTSVTVNAASVADPTKSATAAINLTSGTVKIIPGKLNFGTLKLTGHPQKTLSTTLTNTGASSLDITNQAVSTGPYTVSSPCQGNITTSVTPGNSCTISVTFKPTQNGTFNSSLMVTDNDISSPQSVPLTGHTCSGFRCVGGTGIQGALATNGSLTAPAPTGSYTVGTRVIDLIDTNRTDPYLATGAKRELLVRFWYPAAGSSVCTPAQYASQGVWNYLARLEKVAPFEVQTHSCQDAAVLVGAHPVVVFTHGYTGTFTDYTFLFEDLASRGYVVASVNHTFESTVSEFPNGRIAESRVGSHFALSAQLDERTTSLAVATRLSDLKFVVDELELLNKNPKSAFRGKLDLSRMAIAGHSLGGMTALLGLEMDPRFQAAVTMDGVLPGPFFGRTNKPVLLMLSGRDSWDKETCQLWSKLGGPRLEVNLKGSDHLTPSDAVWLARDAVPTGNVGMEKTVESIRNYVAAFLDTNLKGSASDDLLRGPSGEYPDVEVTTEADSPCQAK